MDRAELSDAIIQELGAVVMAVQEALPELRTADLDGIERRLQAKQCGGRCALAPWHRDCGRPMTADVAVRVAELLSARAGTLAVAESSTGGLILSLLTDVPGASRWLRGGLVAYTNNAKRDLLDVPALTLSTHGAVSPETALEMARGARRLFGAAWALGETGVAGPQTGRRSAKPAGLTFLAVVGERDGQPVERVKRHLLSTPGDRVATKRAFAEAALALLLDELQK